MRFIDTNVFIYAVTAHPQFGKTAKKILERIQNGEEAITSTLVLCEVAWVLEAMGRQGNIKPALEKILSYKSLEIVDFDEDDLFIAANNMSEENVNFNDGLNLALISRMGITEVYSNDKKHLGKIDSLKIIFG